MLSLQASPQQTVGGSSVSEFLRLDNGFYYAEQIQCFPETNLFKYHSLLGRKYSQYTNPESQQANVSVVLSRKPLPIPDSVYDGVAVILFRQYRNIYHCMESFNSLLHYINHRPRLPPVSSSPALNPSCTTSTWPTTTRRASTSVGSTDTFTPSSPFSLQPKLPPFSPARR